MVLSVIVNIFIKMEPAQPHEALSDENSYSDCEMTGGPADDIIPAGWRSWSPSVFCLQSTVLGRVYCYSSDESDSGENPGRGAEVPLHQRIKRSRFVSRIQEERIHIQSEKLDLEQFQPMMTSETVKEIKYKVPRPVKPRHNRRLAKRECSDDWLEETNMIVRKRERREGRESDYGSLGSLDSELLKLDIEQQDPKLEVSTLSKMYYINIFFFRQNSVNPADRASCCQTA